MKPPTNNLDLDLRTLVERFRNDESYRLTADVANPGRDKRKKYGGGLSAQEDTIAQGSRFVCRRYKNQHDDTETIVLRQVTGDSSTEISVSLYAINGMGAAFDGQVVASLHDGDNKQHRETMLGILRALVHEDRSIGTIEGTFIRYGRMSWRILEKLVETGKITVADADAAVALIQAEDDAKEDA